MAVVIDLDRCIDAHLDLKFLNASILAGDPQADVLTGLEILAKAYDVVAFSAVESECLGICSLRKLEGQDAHADEV